MSVKASYLTLFVYLKQKHLFSSTSEELLKYVILLQDMHSKSTHPKYVTKNMQIVSIKKCLKILTSQFFSKARRNDQTGIIQTQYRIPVNIQYPSKTHISSTKGTLQQRPSVPRNEE